MLNNKTIKIKKLIEESIKEHNEIWKDISMDLRFYHRPAGYNCFNLPEDQIIIIASSLVKKIKKI